jgi:hypothetical protein
MTKYEALDTKYGYRKNPLEIEAEAAEEKHYRELWMSIKPKINRV